MAMIELHITFAGMCLLVHDTVAAKPLLHVLLPPTGGHQHGGGGVERHLARLIYDQGSEVPGGAPTTRPRTHALENGLISLAGLGVGDLFPPPGGIVDVEPLVRGKVSRKLLVNTETQDRVLARVTLDAGTGFIAQQDVGGRWFLGEDNVAEQMAIKVEWILNLNLPDAWLDLVIDGMNGDVDRALPRLYPTAANRLYLWVFHTPRNQIPVVLPPVTNRANDPKRGDKAHHFEAYYSLATPPLPVFESAPPLPLPVAGDIQQIVCELRQRGVGVLADSSAGNDLTCIMAKTTADE